MTINKNAGQTSRDEHNDVALAKRSLMIGFDGVNYQVVNVDSDGNIVTGEGSQTGLWKVAEDTNFVSGDSPASVDFNTLIGSNARDFFVICDGPGDILVSFSEDGAAFSDNFTLKKGETVGDNGGSFDTVRITHVTDSAYRVNGR